MISDFKQCYVSTPPNNLLRKLYGSASTLRQNYILKSSLEHVKCMYVGTVCALCLIIILIIQLNTWHIWKRFIISLYKF